MCEWLECGADCFRLQGMQHRVSAREWWASNLESRMVRPWMEQHFAGLLPRVTLRRYLPTLVVIEFLIGERMSSTVSELKVILEGVEGGCCAAVGSMAHYTDLIGIQGIDTPPNHVLSTVLQQDPQSQPPSHLPCAQFGQPTCTLDRQRVTFLDIAGLIATSLLRKK